METKNQKKAERFVLHTMVLCERNKGLAARLRRADNPALQYQSWDYFAHWEVDIEKFWQLLPYTVVASSIAKTKKIRQGKDGQFQDGHLKLGAAIAECYRQEGQIPHENDQAQAKLRRVLACQDIRELSRVLRPVLSLIESRVAQPLNHTELLNQLLRFNYQPDDVKAQWAMEFFRTTDTSPEQERP